jgi:tungstate transport system substrate-binding protein
VSLTDSSAIALAAALLFAGCAQVPAPLPGSAAHERSMVLATTTSTKDTGLLDFLLPEFQDAQHVSVKVVAVGTGRALELGRTGDADVVLSHAPPTEGSYLRNGSYVARYEVMYNQFLLVGPPSDPAGLRAAANVTAAFRSMAEAKAAFISRGDQSGTHLKEQALWAAAGFGYNTQIAIAPNTWYRSVGQGMGATLRIASEQQAYTLSDDGTYWALQPPGLAVIRDNEPPLRNQYSVMLINTSRAPSVQGDLAQALADWMVSPATQLRIASYEVKGHTLFTPDAGLVERGPAAG